MRRISLFGIAVACCALSSGCNTDTSSEDLAALHGEWAWVAIESNGEVTSPEEIKGQRWSIQGNMINAIVPGAEDHQMAFKLNADKTPKEIDLIPQYAPYKGMVTRAIYTLESGTLRVCSADPGEQSVRPAKFGEVMVLKMIAR